MNRLDRDEQRRANERRQRSTERYRAEEQWERIDDEDLLGDRQEEGVPTQAEYDDLIDGEDDLGTRDIRAEFVSPAYEAALKLADQVGDVIETIAKETGAPMTVEPLPLPEEETS